MVEGFWVLEIQPPPVTTGGVILFMQGKVFGGDNGFTWVGAYSLSGRILKGRVRIRNFDPEIKSVLGVLGGYEMHFSGIVNENVITGTAIIAHQPQHSLGLRMDRHAQL